MDKRQFTQPRMGAVEAWYILETEFDENSDIQTVVQEALQRFPGADPEYIEDILGILFRWEILMLESLTEQDVRIECALYDEMARMEEETVDREIELLPAYTYEEPEQLELFH